MTKPMTHKIFLLSHAKDDIREAKNYYNTIVPLLGKRFFNDFRTTLDIIVANPFIYSSRIEGFRTANLKIFPYQEHYNIVDASRSVVIFAVLNAHRDPNYISSIFGK